MKEIQTWPEAFSGDVSSADHSALLQVSLCLCTQLIQAAQHVRANILHPSLAAIMARTRLVGVTWNTFSSYSSLLQHHLQLLNLGPHQLILPLKTLRVCTHTITRRLWDWQWNKHGHQPTFVWGWWCNMWTDTNLQRNCHKLKRPCITDYLNFYRLILLINFPQSHFMDTSSAGYVYTQTQHIALKTNTSAT